MKPKILVVDDEANIASTLSDILRDEGCEVSTAGTGAAGLKAVAAESPDLVLLDIMLPDTSGLELLKQLKTDRPDIEVIMVSGHATVDRAVDAIRSGAYDFLEKPLTLKRVVLTVNRALERRRLAGDKRRQDQAEEQRHRIIGESDATRELRDQLSQVGPTNARVLITGETGTGKELVAFWLHHHSARRDRPYVKINCAAIPKELLESELFGHEKGSFTGAHARKQGRFELADTGTVLLDEIGDMDLRLQAKLLRVLESGEFERVGSTNPLKVDVRVIAATNKNLADEIRKDNFREDLYHRLNVFTIHLPPLRERPDDIPALASHFLDSYCRVNGVPPKKFTEDALKHLMQQGFQGNVRELRNLVERAAIVTPGTEIDRSGLLKLTAHTLTTGDEVFTRTRPLADARLELERKFLEAQLTRFKWNITKTAEELKVERSNLSRRLKQLGITKPEPYS
ncbi:MAG: sigma-54-dependent Fis family transcriptional regulator [candidate division WOR-3 bacterium]|nr:MAG: sigma-54-dependent Fis family transcriptional regulator [candidate division WOR-3 bacterium]